MAQKIDFSLPFQDLNQFVPSNLRNPVISGLISNLFNRMMTHDESVPLYGYVGHKPSLFDDQTVRVPQSTVERDVNAVIPVFHFKQGSETVAFTAQDIIRKAETLGVKTAGQRWLYSQSNNYLPPINIDKFANYFNYFWLGDAPEYYTIARPAASDLNKLSVAAASTSHTVLTGSGFVNQRFKITFIDELSFTLEALDALSGYSAIASVGRTLIGATTVATNSQIQVNGTTLRCTLHPMPAVTGIGSGSVVYDEFFFKVRLGGGQSVQLLKLTLQRNPILNEAGVWAYNEAFASTDTFTISTQFISTTYSLAHSLTLGPKGRIVGVETLSTFQVIDGVQLTAGMRVLVKNNAGTENGIYVVSAGTWSRAPDFDGANIVSNASVWVQDAFGGVNAGKLFTSTVANQSSAANTWVGVLGDSNTNDWREGNRWFSTIELAELGVDSAGIIQATRPIIEYDSNLQLNGCVDAAGKPAASGFNFTQRKTEFNQLPLFDLYRYDGTHAGLVSSIFFYAEDPTADLDLTLQKRVKSSTTDSADYIFNHGLVDSSGNSLFYKIGGELRGIWHAGYSVPTVVDTSFAGKSKGRIASLTPFASATPQDWVLTAISPSAFLATGSDAATHSGVITVGGLYSDAQTTILITDGEIPFAAGETFTFSVLAGPIVTTPVFIGAHKGTLTNVVPAGTTQQQIWTLTATSSTTFSVSGSKTVRLPAGVDVATVGVPYTSAELNFIIAAGDLDFDVGDTFTIRIANAESPRYVFRDEADEVSDFYGGQAVDVDGVGAYQVSRSFVNNPYNDAADDLLEGALYGHFRSILTNQPTGTNLDAAFGGVIKSWSEQHTLLASLLMQKDSTPISIIDFARRQYENGLGAVEDLFKQNIAQYFVSYGVVDYDGTSTQEAKIQALVDFILSIRATDNDVRQVLYDSTSGVTGFPATLPQLGVLPRAIPKIDYNTVLGTQMLFHHDGHTSTLWSDSNDFRQQILDVQYDKVVTLPNGTTATILGGAGNTPPAQPFDGMLWIHATQGTSLMYAYDADPQVAGWRLINLADTLNQVLLRIEKLLYDNCNPNARTIFDGSSSAQAILSAPDYQEMLKSELFLFASKHNYDPLGSDYVASNALTWNYTNAVLSAGVQLNTLSTPARWYDVLEAHQRTVPGVLVTHRPNIEPWRLLGYSTFADWNSSQPSLVLSFTPRVTPDDLGSGEFYDAGYVRVVKTSGSTILAGLQTIDGINLRAGDRVLLTSEADASNNGIWTSSAGGWTRAPIQMLKDSYVSVLEGVEYASTQWVLAADAAIGVDNIVFEQVRYWKAALWTYIQAQRPTLRLSIDAVRDTLLAPYVSITNAQSTNALTTLLPPNRLDGYSYGQNSPVETAWKSTLDYRYSLVKALFKYDPLLFLSYCWGFNWVKVDGVLYDSYDVNIPGHKRFLLHGDEVRQIERTAGCEMTSTTISGSITYDAYEVGGSTRFQNFTVRNSAGEVIGYAREGVTTSLPGIVGLRIEDFGKPFRKGDVFNFSPTTISFVPASRHIFHGFGQTFTHALREASVDSKSSYAVDAYRNWEVDMGYRAGGLVSTDDLVVYTDMDLLSSSSYNLIVKKNHFMRDLWIYGLRISVTIFGDMVTTEDGFIRPAADASDWTFRIENYNPLHTDVKFYNLDTSGTYETFNVLDQRMTDTVWRQYTQHTGLSTANFPLTITGCQNVVNFLFGYTQKLIADGWRFAQDLETNTDEATGRVRTWQLEIEKFLNSVYSGLSVDQGIVVTPFTDQLWVQQDTGLLSEFSDAGLFDINVHPAVFDLGGRKLRSDEIYAIRGNQMSRFGGSAAMYSAHAQLDDYEHLFIFTRYVENSINNGVLYQPFTGSRVVTYKFNGRRQGAETFRPEYGGHYLVGNAVRQNLQASTDGIAAYYDPTKAFESTQTTRHALALLGFNTKKYFDNLDVQEKTQFNFWRGLAQMKGTNMSVSAFLNNDRFQDAAIDEYWAYKVAEYGDARERTFPELKLFVTDTVQQFTQLQFDNDDLSSEGFTTIRNDDEARWFSIDDLNLDTFFKAAEVGKMTVTPSVGDLIKVPFIADSLIVTDPATGNALAHTKINATTIAAGVSGPMVITGFGAATPKYSPIKLINYVANELVEEIPFWHPAAGQHNAVALESINIISTVNPARYNVSTKVTNNNSYDPLRPWGDNELGRIWFDTTNLAYLPYYDTTIFQDRTARLSRWGALADFASVDIYEWVKSSVPPSEYNALALQQSGNADLDQNTKAAGEAALQQTYLRNRLWGIRPIAWSRAARPLAEAHPKFDYSFDSRLFVDGTSISLDRGLFSDYGIVVGSRIGAWDNDSANPRPLCESQVVKIDSKRFVQSNQPQPALAPIDVTLSGITLTINIEMAKYTSVVGPMLFSHLAQDDSAVVRITTVEGVSIYDFGRTLRITEVDTGAVELVTIAQASASTTSIDAPATPTIELATGERLLYDVPGFGLRISVLVSVGGVVDIGVVRDAIVSAFSSNVTIRDSAVIAEITPWVAGTPDGFSNDTLDATRVEWRAWSVPTQANLDADGKQPNAAWKPYLGDFVEAPAFTIAQVQDAVAYAKSPLTMNDGVVIERYSSSWSDWAIVETVRLSGLGTTTLVNQTIVDPARTTVYIDGVIQLSANYTIAGNTITIATPVAAASTVVAIIRRYEPSAEELAFNPDVEDDLTFQHQYKKDFEYVTLSVRDIDGAAVAPSYYFWVTNKSIAARNKKLSTNAIAQALRDGPANYLTFQNLLPPTTTGAVKPYRFDAITISGLSYIVGKNDTFKLRFTRNFTLRDDPNQLDLKDTHTEWTLIRPGQRTAIPEALWLKLTDSLAGQDAIGNEIPATRRVRYDDRNGTRTQFGFGKEQTLAPRDLLISTVTKTIVNTKLVDKTVPPSSSGAYPADFIAALDFNESATWFESASATRKTMTTIWTAAKPAQINEVFFGALNELLAANFELTDIFKTSRLSIFSIRVVNDSSASPKYD